MATSLNNVATSNEYTAATTVEFPWPRPGFTVQVNNASVAYQLAYRVPNARDNIWLAEEHFLQPSIASFRDPSVEGLPPDARFAGIRLRSYTTGFPARVTVA